MFINVKTTTKKDGLSMFNPMICSWLVVWLPFFIFPYIGNVIIPIDELICFRGVGIHPPTSYQCEKPPKRMDFINV